MQPGHGEDLTLGGCLKTARLESSLVGVGTSLQTILAGHR